jgi:hypothetical protein
LRWLGAGGSVRACGFHVSRPAGEATEKVFPLAPWHCSEVDGRYHFLQKLAFWVELAELTFCGVFELKGSVGEREG